MICLFELGSSSGAVGCLSLFSGGGPFCVLLLPCPVFVDVGVGFTIGFRLLNSGTDNFVGHPFCSRTKILKHLYKVKTVKSQNIKTNKEIDRIKGQGLFGFLISSAQCQLQCHLKEFTSPIRLAVYKTPAVNRLCSPFGDGFPMVSQHLSLHAVFLSS